MTIDHGAAEFPYQQLAAILYERIRQGQYRPGQKIPTLAELEDEFGISRSAIRRATDALAGEGWIRKVGGRGTFVDRDLDPGTLAPGWMPLHEGAPPAAADGAPARPVPEG